jgi:hypothetical protein
MEYRIILTVETDDIDQAAWPDESVEVGAVVSVLTEAEGEVLGRVVGIRYQRVEV